MIKNEKDKRLYEYVKMRLFINRKIYEQCLERNPFLIALGIELDRVEEALNHINANVAYNILNKLEKEFIDAIKGYYFIAEDQVIKQYNLRLKDLIPPTNSKKSGIFYSRKAGKL